MPDVTGGRAPAPGCEAAHPGVPCWRTPPDGVYDAAHPPGGYCAPRRCYCGSCPWYVPIDALPTNTPDPYTAFDRRAVESGRRATGGARRRAHGAPAGCTLASPCRRESCPACYPDLHLDGAR